MKFGRKEDLRDLYETPKGHCPPASRGHAPNFGVFFQIFRGVTYKPNRGRKNVLILKFLVPFNSEVNSGWPYYLRHLIDPIGGPHHPLIVGLFLVFLVFLAFAKIRRPEVVMHIDLLPATS